MDLSKVKEIITPQGSLEKILKGGIVIWSKKYTGNKYKILKDRVQVATVTMTEFVKAIHSGAAQEDWGIGAQIVIPYKDPWNEKAYQLSWNFGTFKAYGEGKLGLQTDKAIPTIGLPYGQNGTSYYCKWQDSYIKKWLNATETDSSFSGGSRYSNRNGFLGCIRSDFADMLNVEEYWGTKIFLLTPYQQSAEATIINKQMIWEYWQQRIGELQAKNTTNNNRIISRLNPSDGAYMVITPQIWGNSGLYAFAAYTGKSTNISAGRSSSMKPEMLSLYMPACIVG